MAFSEIVYKGNCNTWIRGDLLQVVFPSVGCQRCPKCTMCSFGRYNRNCTPEEAIKILDNALSVFAKSHKDYSAEEATTYKSKAPGIKLLLGTYGSILDRRECDYLGKIFNYLNSQPHVGAISTIILETHYTTVDISYLSFLRGLLKPNFNNEIPKVVIEMGLESINEKVQGVIHKVIDIAEFANTIAALNHASFSTIANVLFGAPSLSPADQISDCIATISWAYCIGVDEFCVFPLNVWEGSPLWTDYVSGLYQRPSYYGLLCVIDRVTRNALDKISFSWYGDRQLRNPGWNTEQNVLPPDTGRESLRFWVKIFDLINSTKSGEDRVKIVHAAIRCIHTGSLYDTIKERYDFKNVQPLEIDKIIQNMNCQIFPFEQTILAEEANKHE